ncbi:MAG: helix-turn-helix domain-containing protein [Candidatus Desulforudaceae bacterium]
MGYGTAVREARAVYRRTQDDVARAVHISDSVLSDIERGKRDAQPDVMQALIIELDDPRLLIETQLVATGGIGSPYLNNVDRHRMTMKAKVREELQEVLEIFDHAQTILINAQGPEHLTDEQLQEIKQVVIEMVEAKTALTNTIAEFCILYRISARQIFQEHREKMVRSGYLKKEKRHP